MPHQHQIHAHTITNLTSRTIIVQSIVPILTDSLLNSLFEGFKIAGTVLLNGNFRGSTINSFSFKDGLIAASMKAFVSFRSKLYLPTILELNGLRIQETRLLVRRATLCEILEVGIEKFVYFCPQVLYLAPKPMELGVLKKACSEENVTISMAGRRFAREYTIVEEGGETDWGTTLVPSPISSVKSGMWSEENKGRRPWRQNNIGRIQRIIQRWKTDMSPEKSLLFWPFHNIQSINSSVEEEEVKSLVTPEPDPLTVTLVKSRIVKLLELQAETLSSTFHIPYLVASMRHLFLYIDLIWGDFLTEYGLKVDISKFHVDAELEVEAAFDNIFAVAKTTLEDIGELENETTSVITLLKLAKIRRKLNNRLQRLLKDSAEGKKPSDSSRTTRSSGWSSLSSEAPTAWLMIGEKLSQCAA